MRAAKTVRYFTLILLMISLLFFQAGCEDNSPFFMFSHYFDIYAGEHGLQDDEGFVDPNDLYCEQGPEDFVEQLLLEWQDSPQGLAWLQSPEHERPPFIDSFTAFLNNDPAFHVPETASEADDTARVEEGSPDDAEDIAAEDIAVSLDGTWSGQWIMTSSDTLKEDFSITELPDDFLKGFPGGREACEDAWDQIIRDIFRELLNKEVPLTLGLQSGESEGAYMGYVIIHMEEALESVVDPADPMYFEAFFHNGSLKFVVHIQDPDQQDSNIYMHFEGSLTAGKNLEGTFSVPAGNFNLMSGSWKANLWGGEGAVAETGEENGIETDLVAGAEAEEISESEDQTEAGDDDRVDDQIKEETAREDTSAEARAALEAAMARVVEEKINEGYYVKNRNIFTSVWALADYNPIQNARDRRLNQIGARCEEYAVWGQRWSREFANEIYGEGTITTDVVMQGFWISNHAATMIMTPDGEMLVLDYWESITAGEPRIYDFVQWVERYERTLTGSKTLYPSQGKIGTYALFELYDLVEYYKDTWTIEEIYDGFRGRYINHPQVADTVIKCYERYLQNGKIDMPVKRF